MEEGSGFERRDPRQRNKRIRKLGAGQAMAHHGELVQGVFEDDDGHLHRALVTLPLASLRSRATFRKTNSSSVEIVQARKTKARHAARLTLEHLGHPGAGGELSCESSIPVGHGYGSSTADVVATIRAVSAVYGVELSPSSICSIAVAAEGASDAIAYENRSVLFAHREGIVLEDFSDTLPPLILVSFKPDHGQPIDTMQLPPARYRAEEIQMFRVVRGLIARAIRFQDAALLGRAATLSAQISQRHLPKQHFDIAFEVANQAGACGVQVAHSGSLIGILIDLSEKAARQKAATIAKAVDGIGFVETQIHLIGAEGMKQ